MNLATGSALTWNRGRHGRVPVRVVHVPLDAYEPSVDVTYVGENGLRMDQIGIHSLVEPTAEEVAIAAGFVWPQRRILDMARTALRHGRIGYAMRLLDLMLIDLPGEES